MSFDPTLWTRLEKHGRPIWVRPDRPDWFVPNPAGDELLRSLASGNRPTLDASDAAFLARLPDEAPEPYAGRSQALSTDALKELWLHITNRCDMACRHCLFSCSTKTPDELPADRVLEVAHAAADLGCRVFALTGGEPLVHGDFRRIVEGLLAIDGSAIAILSNGMSLDRHVGELPTGAEHRVHWQISIDGLQPSHDHIRGRGAFERLTAQLKGLARIDVPYTVSMSVRHDTAHEMPDVVDLAADLGAGNVHFMWYFVRGRAAGDTLPDNGFLEEQLTRAQDRAEARGLSIDNVDAMKTQVFSPAGTRHDGTTSGWESLTLGPDGKLYPSPATVGLEPLAVEVNGNLASAWRESAPLHAWRGASVAELSSPLRFLVGGGDPDHSYVHADTLVGGDPYLPLHEQLALGLIANEVNGAADDASPGLLLKMGDVLERCHTHGEVALTHSNCLLALSDQQGITAIKEFYADAAEHTHTDIVNPVCYDEDSIRHIPAEFRFRGYGCGSPVLDADIAPGDTVVDLGSGTGIECFIASKLVGRNGRVIGVDMLDPMLERARAAADPVARNLGWANVEFRSGYLEQLPLDDDSVDVILSNCVLNLSTHKRKTFAEIRRVLRPGGRMVVSDVVCETDPGPSIRNDDEMRGECLGGALTHRDLCGLLDESGFCGLRILKRYPYREVDGHPFFSMTFEARTPKATAETVRAMYRGPFAAITLDDGAVLPAGQVVTVDASLARAAGEQLFIFDVGGAVENVELETCACLVSPEQTDRAPAAQPTGPFPGVADITLGAQRDEGCMVCGAELVYAASEQTQTCHYCDREAGSAMTCPEGHFVCDGCHASDGLAVIESICSSTHETDMIALLSTVRAHPAMSVHGPEHHALVPGIVVATCRNAGFPVTDAMLRSALTRGAKIPGGSCAYMGVCGAASGVGAGFSVLLEGNPLAAQARQRVLRAVGEVTRELAGFEAARCCQRDCWVALRTAASLAPELVGVSPTADAPLECTQLTSNRACLGRECPLHP
jgi:MoaA/NifB/PqqE/SkfB family radical SAM enzyme/SAM-dependent methyltransferase